MPHYDWVFWLNVTNIALGVVVVLALLLVAYGIIWEVMIRHRKHTGLRDVDTEMNKMLNADFAHTFHVPELGLTMADGGEHRKLEPKKTTTEEKKSK